MGNETKHMDKGIILPAKALAMGGRWEVKTAGRYVHDYSTSLHTSNMHV